MSSLAGLQETIAAGYDAAIGRKPWPSALNQVASLVDCEVVLIGLQQHDLCVAITNKSWAARACAVSSGECWSGWMPATHLLHHSRVGEPVQTTAIVPWLRPLQPTVEGQWQDGEVIEALLFREVDSAGFFGAAGPTGGSRFKEAKIDIIRMLLPHLGRAMEIHIRLAARERRNAWLEAALDHFGKLVIIVDCEHNILHSNLKAKKMLAAGTDLRAERNRVCGRDAKSTAALRRMITRSMAAETAPQLADAMLLERGTDRCPLLVGVVPLKTTRPLALPWNSPSAIVLVADPEASDRGASGLLRALYALTSREESVVRLIAKGCGTKVAARTLGIAPSTVRTHLHQVFAKTGVKCQAELASLVQRLE